MGYTVPFNSGRTFIRKDRTTTHPSELWTVHWRLSKKIMNGKDQCSRWRHGMLKVTRRTRSWLQWSSSCDSIILNRCVWIRTLMWSRPRWLKELCVNVHHMHWEHIFDCFRRFGGFTDTQCFVIRNFWFASDLESKIEFLK